MSRRSPALAVLLSLLLGAFASFRGPLGAGEPSLRPLAVGKTAGDFALRDIHGREHRLSSYRGRAAIVLAFNGLGCPIAELYAPRIERLHQRYRRRGVVVLGINSNRFDRVSDLRSFASGYGLTFPILKDHDNRVADMLGVERTTEVLVLDGALRLRYRGRLDDQYAVTDRSVGIRKDRPERRFVEDALDALIAGKEVAVKTTEPLGCVIGRRRVVRDATSITFHRDVQPIIQRRCQFCHREGEIAPFELFTYEDVAGWSGMIREVVVNRRMPPWHADPAFGEFANDRSLSPAELETIVGWIDNGTPRGDPADRPPPVTYPKEWKIGTPDAVFEIPEPFDVPAEGTIPYRYAVVKTDFPEDRWVAASEVQPGDSSVVHHILVFAVDPRNPRKWRRETRGGLRGYFSIMVPGERPVIYPEGMAKRLPAGARLVFQIHYTASGRAARDRSRIGLVFARGPITHEVKTRSAYNQVGLVIPPGAERHEVTATYRFKRPVRILSLLPHMHLRGESFRYDLHFPVSVHVSKPPDWGRLPAGLVSRFDYDASSGRLLFRGELPDDARDALMAMYRSPGDRKAVETLAREGRSETLLWVPRYDFGWQNTYRFKEPVEVPAGALLSCAAFYNNSRFNPALTRDMYSKTVFWGNQTWDEMLIGYFDVIDAIDAP